MLIKTEQYVDENGIQKRKEYYGPDEDHITAVIEDVYVDESEISEEVIEENTSNNNEDDTLDQDKVLAQILLNQSLIMQKIQDIENSSNNTVLSEEE